MSASEREGPSAIDLAIDDVCERYESARRSGAPLPLARVLDEAEVEAPARPRLFLELLLLELELRMADGERPDADDYLARFPGFAREVVAAFAGASLGRASRRRP